MGYRLSLTGSWRCGLLGAFDESILLRGSGGAVSQMMSDAF